MSSLDEDRWTQVVMALRIAKLSLIVCAIGGAWMSGYSAANGHIIREVLGGFVAVVAGWAIFLLAHLSVGRR